MMNPFDFTNYMNISESNAMETLAIEKKFVKDPLMFKFALADLLYAYDELACSIHDDSDTLDSLLHLYARLSVFKYELISIGARQTLIDLVSHETARVFAQCAQFDSISSIDFTNALVHRII